MSADSSAIYSLTLKQLSADAKAWGSDLPDTRLDGVTSKKLRGLLDSLAKLAPKVAYPAAPELRIAAPQGQFIVRVSGGRLEFISWSSSQHASGALTAAQIHAVITGEGLEEEAAPVATTSPRDRAARRRVTAVSALLILAIVLVNSFTVWLLAKPPKTLLPKYTLIAPEPAERVLTSAAGVYETGTGPGDRQLKIGKGGDVEWIKLGKNKHAIDTKQFTVSAAKVGEKVALLTSRRSMIEIKDPSVLVLYGDTYRRKLPDVK